MDEPDANRFAAMQSIGMSVKTVCALRDLALRGAQHVPLLLLPQLRHQHGFDNRDTDSTLSSLM